MLQSRRKNMENNDMNNHSVGLREKLKSIINNAEDMLKFVEVQSLKTFIATVPNTRSFQAGDYMDFDFHNTETYNLLGYNSDSKSNTIFQAFGLAAKAFFHGAELTCEYYHPSMIGSQLKIDIISIPTEETTVFLIKEESGMFTSYYDSDEGFFNYMLGEGFTEPALNSGFTPSQHDILLAYYYLHYVSLNKNTIFVFINADFNYRGIDFSLLAKQYIKRNLALTLEFVGAVGIEKALSYLDIAPFDFFFKKYAHAANVDYFISKLDRCVKEHTLNIQNIGKLIKPNINYIISMFAFASNNHVGTRYCSREIVSVNSNSV